jgi:hypothetical protein
MVRYKKQLQEIREIGLNSLILDPFPDIERFDQAISLIKELGFLGPIIIQCKPETEVIKEHVEVLRKYGYPPIVYPFDEPSLRNKIDYKIIAERVHEAGAQTAAAIKFRNAVQFMDDGIRLSI